MCEYQISGITLAWMKLGVPPRSFLLRAERGNHNQTISNPKVSFESGENHKTTTQPFPRKQGNFDEVLVESYALEQEMLGLAIRLSLEIGTSDYATPVFVHIHLPPTIAKKEISAKLGFQSALRRLIMFYYHPLWWFESNTHMALHGIKRQLPSNLRISFEKGILQGAIELHLLCVQETGAHGPGHAQPRYQKHHGGWGAWRISAGHQGFLGREHSQACVFCC